uniref:Cyclic nucleotide-binding domain-containing protein n=1 Tax=Hanusia phi TaxID=3032 RepID=A0A7S0HH42_9CRYP|mmetsp:Transcript_18301/g.41646  ORF Transcript_18301/g.41646 Transcript_18301/m.41646 type:complete len:358 (+) Transcript_18301:147-1220(+)|eukprot:752800-Hanusia_phi.AAC.3
MSMVEVHQRSYNEEEESPRCSSRRGNIELQEKMRILMNSPIIRARAVDVNCLQFVAQKMAVRLVEQGDFIARKGCHGTHMFWLVSGNCECILDDKVIDYLQPGRCFGEMLVVKLCKLIRDGVNIHTALKECRRSADIMATKPCTLLELSYQAVLPLMRMVPNLWFSLEDCIRLNNERMRRTRLLELRVEAVKNSPLDIDGRVAALLQSSTMHARTVDISCLRELADKMTVSVAKKDEIIARKDTVGTHMFWVASGSCICLLDGVILERLERGQCFGEMSVMKICKMLKQGISKERALSEGRRGADVKASEDSLLLALSYDDAYTLIRVVPNLWLTLEELCKLRKLRVQRMLVCSLDN